MTLKWIAEQLMMGSGSNVSNLLAAPANQTMMNSRKVLKVRTDPFMRALILTLYLLISYSCFAEDEADQIVSTNRISQKTPFALAFLDSEIRSRCWADASGRKMALLSLSAIPYEPDLDIILAAYGVTGSRETYCLDVYEKHKSIPGVEQSYLLILHDIQFWPITQLEATNRNNEITIRIQRIFQSKDSKKSVATDYSYTYDVTNGIHRGISEFISGGK